MEICIICHKHENVAHLVKLREKGCQGITKASRERGDDINALPGQFVHHECRKLYTNPYEIAKYNRQKHVLKEPVANIPKLRSTSQFNFGNHCLFCGKEAHKSKAKGNDVFPVRTDDFQRRIYEICNDRDDEWAFEVRGRLESVNDLHAADAIYHQACSVNFRTSKRVPQVFSPNPKTKENTKGRPALYEYQFSKIVNYLKDHEDEQITIVDLVDKMNGLCKEQAFSSVYMKKRLRNYFGENIIITDICGKSSVVTLRDTASSILQEFYQRPTYDNSGDEKRAIIEAAAKLIKSDIRSVKVIKEHYPTPTDISSLESNSKYIPDSLGLLLKMLFVEKDSRLKIASIGQAVMQAPRPRVLIASLQIGLGVQLHHNFASRFLVSTLNSLGYCSSYQEIQKYESSAALAQGIEIPGEINNSFIQFVAVGHNIRTIDCNNTFHGMGIIAGVTPGTRRATPIPRLNVSSDDISSIAKISIHFYRPKHNFRAKFRFSELRELKAMDTTACIDFTITCSLAFKKSNTWMVRYYADDTQGRISWKNSCNISAND